jgi:hypothetical protein
MKKCPFCTAAVPPLACKCPNCGEWVESAFPDPATDPRTRGEVGTQRFVGVYLGLTTIGMLVGLGVFFYMALPFLGQMQRDREQIKKELQGGGRAPPRNLSAPSPPEAPAR